MITKNEIITAKKLQKNLRANRNLDQAKHAGRFFKTGPGEYAEGDKFLGIRVPITRQLIKPFYDLPLTEIQILLTSEFHEERLAAVFILVKQFQSTKDQQTKKQIYEFYLQNLRYINNWDLIDTTTPHIVGAYLFDKNINILVKFARSQNLWQRRVAMLATFYHIRHDVFQPALKIAKMLQHDDEDLIHKAVGWMLREIGKRDQTCLELYLNECYQHLPRTMLRYAIERLPVAKKKIYMQK